MGYAPLREREPPGCGMTEGNTFQTGSQSRQIASRSEIDLAQMKKTRIHKDQE